MKLVCFVYTQATKKLEWNLAQKQQNTVTNYIYNMGHKHMACEGTMCSPRSFWEFLNK